MSSINTLIYVLSAYIPDILGIVIGLMMLLGMARPSAERRLGVIGLALMLVATLVRLGATFAQNAMLASGGTLNDTMTLFIGIHVLLNLLSVAGLLTLVYGFCKALPNVARR